MNIINTGLYSNKWWVPHKWVKPYIQGLNHACSCNTQLGRSAFLAIHEFDERGLL